jgi:hypothetical protein
MDPVAMILGTSWTITGLVMIGVSIPLVQGRIRPNRLYGVRLAQSFQSEDAWFAINRFGGKHLIAWAVPLVCIGIGCFFLRLAPHPAFTLAIGFLPCICIAAAAFQIWRFARHYQSRG